MTDDSDLPLFRWRPQCRVIAYPPARRIGKARDVAAKWLQQKTRKQADAYAIRIDDDLDDHLMRLGVHEQERKAMRDGFWQTVRREIARLQRCDSRPGGSAA
ncbi:DUF6074 family protein [Mesorhizobium sp. WSM3876]|uniref:DUF6074 family protein n=1 Tax=Mesorhizobium sp. WSM3876 TaxID=422277 RepID=UPI000BAE9836|nr:DUF6074 family protein [Mesorhizobium sp. WSM3876]PBB85723.1 hypothetical protein CK216_16480 [Mesorhizobium sp. WSM3876]